MTVLLWVLTHPALLFLVLVIALAGAVWASWDDE